MSATADSTEHEDEVDQSNDEQLKILKAILVGIAYITGTKTAKELIEEAEELNDE